MLNLLKMIENLRFKPSSCLRVQKFCMKRLGFWHYEGSFRTLYILYRNIIYAWISYLFVVTMLINIIKVWGDMTDMADGLYITVTVLNIVFKAGLLDLKKLKMIMEMLDSKELNVQTEDQDIFVKKAMKSAYNNGLAFLSIPTTVVWCGNIGPLLAGAYTIKKLPIDAWYPFPYKESPYYEVAYVFQSFGMWFGAIVNTSIDGMVAGFLSLTCAQILVLKHSLQNLRKKALEQIGQLDKNEINIITTDNELTSNKKIELEEVYQQMVNCINHHQAIIEYVNEIQNTFNESMFSQFLSSMLIICITAFELSITKPFTTRFFTTSLYMINMIIQLFFYCWYGNELFLLSQTINDDVYNSDWIYFDSRITKLMLIMMERSKKPVSLTAGKLFQLSLDTFTSIMKSAYSFYAVLKQMELDINLGEPNNPPI